MEEEVKNDKSSLAKAEMEKRQLQERFTEMEKVNASKKIVYNLLVQFIRYQPTLLTVGFNGLPQQFIYTILYFFYLVFTKGISELSGGGL